jgi:hypothetical protein
MSRLKKNIHLWEINYFINGINMSTVINTGFIYDIHLVQRYFMAEEPEAKFVSIQLIKDKE